MRPSRQSCRELIVLSTVLITLFWGRFAFSQPAGGVGAGENPWSESARDPFEIQMSGVINPEIEGDAGEEGDEEAESLAKVQGDSLTVVTLGIANFHEIYRFEVVKVEVPGNPQVSAHQVLQKAGKRQYDFSLIGPAALLSKVAQSLPGTPLKIVGMYAPRDQRLQLLSVDAIGMEKP